MANEIALIDKQSVIEKTGSLEKRVAALQVSKASDLLEAQTLLKGAQQLAKFVEEQREIAVKPLNDQKAAIQALAKELDAPIQVCLAKIKGQITAYHDKVEQERLAKEREMLTFRRALAMCKTENEVDVALARLSFEDATISLEATQRKNAIIQELAQEAERKRLADEQKRLDAIKKSQNAEAAKLEAQRMELENQKRKAEQEAARIESEKKEAEMKRQADEAKSRQEAISVINTPKGIRKVKKFEVTNPELLPRKYLTADEKTIRADVAAGVENIPGVRIWVDTDVR